MNVNLLKIIAKTGIVTPTFVKNIIDGLSLPSEHKVALTNCIPRLFAKFAIGNFDNINGLQTLKYSDMWCNFTDLDTALSETDRLLVFDALMLTLSATFTDLSAQCADMTADADIPEN